MIVNLKKNQTGSLLVNLIVVTGIIALMTTISIPYLRQYQPNLKLSADSRALTGNLRLAQQLTITEQVPHLVFFDFSNDRYSILKLPSPLATSTVLTVNLDSEVAFQQINGLTGNLVRFNSYGAVSEAGDVVLINTNAKIATVFIKPSGYIQLVQ